MCKRRNESSQIKREDYENQFGSGNMMMFAEAGSTPAFANDFNNNTVYGNSIGVQEQKRQFVRAIRRSSPSQGN